jgi:hypothetical protein
MRRIVVAELSEGATLRQVEAKRRREENSRLIVTKQPPGNFQLKDSRGNPQDVAPPDGCEAERKRDGVVFGRGGLCRSQQARRNTLRKEPKKAGTKKEPLPREALALMGNLLTVVRAKRWEDA